MKFKRLSSKNLENVDQKVLIPEKKEDIQKKNVNLKKFNIKEPYIKNYSELLIPKKIKNDYDINQKDQNNMIEIKKNSFFSKNKIIFFDKFYKIEKKFEKKISTNLFGNENYFKKELENDFKIFKIKNFNNLYKVLVDWFAYNKFINNEFIEKENFKIIIAIIERKFNEKIQHYLNIKDYTLLNDTIYKEIENIFSKNFKRKEENLKLIIRSSVKYMFKTYCKNLNINFKNNLMDNFYKLYFEDISNELNIELSYFYLPQINKKNKKTFKSFNNKYFKLISNNKTFIKELKNSIFHKFSDNKIINKIEKKIYKLLKFWENKIINGDYNYDMLINNIKNNIKLKLPWTFSEIFNAKKIALKKIY